MLGFGLTAFSPLFFNFISGWQIAFFVALTIGSLAMAGGYSDSITAKKKAQREMVSEYNLAKEELQAKVMELQKKLAQHNSDMQQIETQAKFSFKKSQEMTV